MVPSVAPDQAGQGSASTLGRLRDLAQAVALSRGWSRRLVGFAAGALSTLAFAPFFAWPVLFATFPILFWLIDGSATEQRPVRSAARDGWWFGFGYFFAGLFWIGEAFLVEPDVFAWLLPFAVTFLPAALALFWALAASLALRMNQALGLVSGINPHPPSNQTSAATGRCLILAVCLSLTEWLRGHILTGFPWDVPGVALTEPLPLMQAVSVFGVYGLTLWTVFICTIPLVVLASAERGTVWRALQYLALLSGLPLVIAYGLGWWHLAQVRSVNLPGVKVRIVQPSVPQRDKWSSAKQSAIFADHLDLSRRDSHGQVDDLTGITHLIWPEAAMPFGPLEHPEAQRAIGQLLPHGVQLLAGGLRVDRDEASPTYGRAYNSLMVFGDQGKLVGLYDKVHLVPFGEYLPFQSALEAIGLQSLTRQRGGFTSGVIPKSLLRVQGLPAIEPLICYEAIFPEEANPSPERSGLIIVATNDGWFGNTTGPQQHFHQARLRAVEQGVTVVRSANNGISAVIDPEGHILNLLALNARGSIDSELPTARSPTVYACWGEKILVFNMLVFLLAAIIVARQRDHLIYLLSISAAWYLRLTYLSSTATHCGQGRALDEGVAHDGDGS